MGLSEVAECHLNVNHTLGKFPSPVPKGAKNKSKSGGLNFATSACTEPKKNFLFMSLHQQQWGQ